MRRIWGSIDESIVIIRCPSKDGTSEMGHSPHPKMDPGVLDGNMT
jgi:hypothetical protein